MARSVLVTGATGCIGSHLVEALLGRGDRVVVIARPSSDTAFLEQRGATVVRGDFRDPTIQNSTLPNVDTVVHCAATVGDWGPIDDYRPINVDGLRKFLDGCKGRKLHRFVYLSSSTVYPLRHHYQTDETEPLPEQLTDGYAQSKVEGERVIQEFVAAGDIPMVVLRPGSVYGPRDRTFLPRVVENLKRGVVRYVSGGRYALNTSYVSNVVDAILLAIDRPQAVGRIYNINDGEFVSKRRYLETVASSLGLKPPKMGGPLWAAKMLTKMVERHARKRGWKEAPRLTMARLRFLGLNLDFSIARARTELGYQPKVGFDEGMKRAIEWYKTNHPENSASPSREG